ncbi:MAG TPA: hypothetical protein DEF18_10565 [Muricauda sp.]|nr:hypothetical protein [Allomuricauda sp.]
MAFTVFMVVVGLVYQLLLRDIGNPTGLQMVLDELLHTIIPVFMYVYWLMFCSKAVVEWKQLSKWLFYPLGYVVFVLVRGHFSGFYPYPFLNVLELGLGSVLLNSCFVLLLMLLVMAALYFLGKLLRPKQ